MADAQAAPAATPPSTLSPELQQTYQQIFAAIKQAKHIMLVMHRKPDGDTAGACLALSHYLDTLNKPHTCFCIDDLSPALQFLPGKHKLTSDPVHWEPSTAKFDLVIVFDSGDLKYNGIDQYVDQLTHDFTMINIDHHATNARYGDHNLVITSASSTCEIVHDLLNSINALNKDMATCLMTGLITDTGSFTNLATTASAIEVASKLLLHGVDYHLINRRTMYHRPLPTLKLWGRAMERLRRDKHGVVTTVITKQDLTEFGAAEGDIEGIANFLNTLDGDKEARVVMVLSERDGQIKGSLRTKHPLIDVAQFATVLGGGGHKKAAGFSVEGQVVESDDRWLIVSQLQV